MNSKKIARKYNSSCTKLIKSHAASLKLLAKARKISAVATKGRSDGHADNQVSALAESGVRIAAASIETAKYVNEMAAYVQVQRERMATAYSRAFNDQPLPDSCCKCDNVDLSDGQDGVAAPEIAPISKPPISTTPISKPSDDRTSSEEEPATTTSLDDNDITTDIPDSTTSPPKPAPMWNGWVKRAHDRSKQDTPDLTTPQADLTTPQADDDDMDISTNISAGNSTHTTTEAVGKYITPIIVGSIHAKQGNRHPPAVPASEGVLYPSANPRLVLTAQRHASRCGCAADRLIHVIARACGANHPLSQCHLPCSVCSHEGQARLPASEGEIYPNPKPNFMLVAQRLTSTCGCRNDRSLLHIIATACAHTPLKCQPPCSVCTAPPVNTFQALEALIPS